MLLKVMGSFAAMEEDVDFKLCSEILEYRRIYVYRRWRFAKKLAALSSYLAKRRRRMHGDMRSTNLFGARMTGYIRRKDRANEKLLTRYTLKYQKIHRAALQELKNAKIKTSLMCAKMKKTLKLRRWRTGMYKFWIEIKNILDLNSEPWTHSDDVVARLRQALAHMVKNETTTSKGWQQLEIRGMLERAMEKLFWI